MSEENVSIVRRSYEMYNALGQTGDEFVEADVFWFRDGMIVRIEGYATQAEALEAANGPRAGV